MGLVGVNAVVIIKKSRSGLFCSLFSLLRIVLQLKRYLTDWEASRTTLLTEMADSWFVDDYNGYCNDITRSDVCWRLLLLNFYYSIAIFPSQIVSAPILTSFGLFIKLQTAPNKRIYIITTWYIRLFGNSMTIWCILNPEITHSQWNFEWNFAVLMYVIKTYIYLKLKLFIISGVIQLF